MAVNFYALGQHVALAKYAATDDDIVRGSQETANRFSEVARRETARLQALGLPVPDHTTHAAFLTLPGNVSDVDLAIPHEGNREHIQSILESNGVPFRRMHGENAVHSYTTPEGVWVDVGIRPKRELDFIRNGLEGLNKLTPERKRELLLEKYRVHASGDTAAYKQWKQRFYEQHGIVPPGGDWSKVSTLATGMCSHRWVNDQCVKCGLHRATFLQQTRGGVGAPRTPVFGSRKPSV